MGTISDALHDRIFGPAPAPAPAAKPAPMGGLKAVITCVDYSDFLSFTLPFNKPQFNDLVVVTTPADRKTQRVCEFWNVRCVATDVFTAKGTFCKGSGINAGLEALKVGAWGAGSWAVHMDADVALPPLSRQLLSAAGLDGRCLYGVDRVMCRSFDAWAGFLSEPTPQHEQDVFVHPSFPVGVRVLKRASGYIPIGYFQLWCPALSGVRTYPDEHTDAARGDMLFALQWERPHRRLIPDLFAYHLESESTPMGANWQGRTTARFGPKPAGPVVPAVEDKKGYG